MAEGYCVKCKSKIEIAEAVEGTMKDGRKAIKGKCPNCGMVVMKILGGKASALSAEAEAQASEPAPPPASTPDPEPGTPDVPPSSTPSA